MDVEANDRRLHVKVALEPALNALNSMALLNKVDQGLKLDPWIIRTAALLSTEQQRTNRQIFDVMGQNLAAIQPEQSFEALLDYLSNRPLGLLRHDLLGRTDLSDPALDPLIEDSLLLQDVVVTHLRMLWDTALKAEWSGKQRTLNFAVEGLERYAFPSGTPASTIRGFLGRDLADVDPDSLQEVHTIIFVPSLHNEGHLTTWRTKGTLRICFGLHSLGIRPWRRSEVGRGELLARLNALADDTRLQILQLFAQREELTAQEVIAELGLSQSMASRHLSQLQNTGFLLERRRGGANKSYRLARHQVADTFRAVEQLLGPEAAELPSAPALNIDPELVRFLDKEGRVTTWPAKQRDKQLVLEYLATRFEREQHYTEREVNDHLNRWHTYGDPVTLRRELYDNHLLNRDRNGARYWLADRG